MEKGNNTWRSVRTRFRIGSGSVVRQTKECMNGSHSGKPTKDQKLVCDFFYEAGD
jgi:hypothetical protein